MEDPTHSKKYGIINKYLGITIPLISCNSSLVNLFFTDYFSTFAYFLP